MGLLDGVKQLISPDHQEPTPSQELVSTEPEAPVTPPPRPREALKLGITFDDQGKARGLYLPEEDRTTHMHVVGSSGVGKSKGMVFWILEDIKAGRGCGVIDPHGDLIVDVITHLPYRGVTREEILSRVVLVDVTDPTRAVGFNPLEKQPGVAPFRQTLELVEVFKKIWELSDAATPRLLEILRNTTCTLIETGGTMLDIEPLLTDEAFRESLIGEVENPAVRSFWLSRFNRWNKREQVINVESTLNKVSSFTSDPRIRAIIGQKESTIDLREIMDEGKVLLINLSKAQLKGNCHLLGALFVAKIQMAAMSRMEETFEGRRRFHLYVDEFQNFATESFAEMLDEVRKYGLSVTLAHQHLAQLNERVMASVLSNAKNLVCFRVDREDAEILSKHLFEVDPLMVKYWREAGPDFYSVGEQWEVLTQELTSLPVREALLRTWGKSPCWFTTYDVADLREDLFLVDVVREIGVEVGYARRREEITERKEKEERLYVREEREGTDQYWEEAPARSEG